MTSLLSRSPVRATIPVVDIERAKTFYEEKLGLAPVPLDMPGLAAYRAGEGTILILYQREPAKADHTLMSFAVPHIESAVSELKRRGVQFEEYDLPHMKTVEGIAKWGKEKAAWFKDTEGNIIGINERREDTSPAAATSMNMSRIGFLIVALVVVLGALGLAIWGITVLNGDRSSNDDRNDGVLSFEECVAAGYPVMESYPRQCRTPDGQLFVEEVGDQPNLPEASQDIETRAGTLTLSWADGWAKLEGTLSRSVPCVNWRIQTDQDSSGITFNVEDANKGVVCIQVLGTPQNISTLVQTPVDTHFTVQFEGETLWEGTLQ